MQKEMRNNAFQVEERLKKLERGQRRGARLGEVLGKRRVGGLHHCEEGGTGVQLLCGVRGSVGETDELRVRDRACCMLC